MIGHIQATCFVHAIIGYLLLGGLACQPWNGQAAQARGLDPVQSSHCLRAIEVASANSGVPKDILLAISLTETGRKLEGKLRPWPWTVNMEGAGLWFETPQEALDYASNHFKRGARSFDVGCFQINYRWHGQAFSSIEEMFDPIANARYAARFLGELFTEFGDWSKAAGAYHSRTPKFATRYSARFDRFRARLGDPVPPVQVAAYDGDQKQPTSIPSPDLRINLFPLLQQSGANRAPGSLVPLNGEPASGHRLIGGATRG